MRGVSEKCKENVDNPIWKLKLKNKINLMAVQIKCHKFNNFYDSEWKEDVDAKSNVFSFSFSRSLPPLTM